jgi:hypothetical protein
MRREASMTNEDEDKLVTRINTPSTGEVEHVFGLAVTSGEMMTDTTSGSDLGIKEVEILTEVVDRGRGLIDSGFKFSLEIPKWLGGGSIEIEKKPVKEIKTTVHKRYNNRS